MKNKKFIGCILAATVLLTPLQTQCSLHNGITRSAEYIYRGALLICVLNVVRQGTCWIGKLFGLHNFLASWHLCNGKIPKNMEEMKDAVIKHDTRLASLEHHMKHRVTTKDFNKLASRISLIEALDLADHKIQVTSAFNRLSSDVSGLSNALQEHIAPQHLITECTPTQEPKKGIGSKLRGALKKKVEFSEIQVPNFPEPLTKVTVTDA